MDNSSILVDNSQYRMKLSEALENAFNLIEKGTWNIYKEISKIREDATSVLNKFMEYCEREGLPFDLILDESNSRASLDKEIFSLNSNTKKQHDNSTKIPFKKLKFEKIGVRKNNSNIQMLNLFPSNSTPFKGVSNPFNNSSKLVNSTIKSKNRSKSKNNGENKQTINHYTKVNEMSNNLNQNLSEVNLIKNLPKISDNKNANTESLNKSGILSKFNEIQNQYNITNKIINTPTNNNIQKYFFMGNHNYNHSIKYKTEKVNNVSYTNKKENLETMGKGSNSKEKGHLINRNNVRHNTTLKKRKHNFNNIMDSYTEEKIELNKTNLDIQNAMEKQSSFKFSNKVTISYDADLNHNDNLEVKNINNNNNFNINMNKVNNDVNSGINKLSVVKNKNIDDRKLSILDIASGEPLGIEGGTGENNTSTASMRFVKKSEYNKKLFEKLRNKRLKVFYILAYSDIMPIKMRIIFSKISKVIYEHYPPKMILQDYGFLLKNKISQLELAINHYLSQPEYEKLINLQFKPSKTAQNCLNFITKEDELNLVKENFDDSDDIKSIFKFVFILLKLNFDFLNKKSPADYLINTILVKMKLENIKSLFLNVISHSLLISNDQYWKIVAIVENHKSIIDHGTMIKVNKIFGYITFILKEIYEYLNIKTKDGVFIFNLRKQKQELKKMRDKFNKINHYLLK